MSRPTSGAGKYDGTSLNVSAFNIVSVPTYLDGTCTYSRIREKLGAPNGCTFPFGSRVGAPVAGSRTTSATPGASKPLGVSTAELANTFSKCPNGPCMNPQRAVFVTGL